MSKLFKLCYSQSLFKHVSFVSATHSVGHTVKMCTIVKYFAPAFNPARKKNILPNGHKVFKFH